MSLKYYSQLALKEARLTSDAELSKVQFLEGILQTDRENLILAYAGSFNPPHKGHIDVLLSGLRQEIAAVAVVVVPSEDHFLRNKIRNKHPDFFLEQRRRADILEALPSVPKSKVWIWPSTWYPLKLFMEALVQLTAADGFKTTFLWLVGPDLLNSKNPTMVVPYDLPGVLISNKARHIMAHFLPNGKPVVWNGFGEWSRSPCTEDDKNFNGPDAAILWTCTGQGSLSDKRAYYLQYTSPPSEDINSTQMRRNFTQDRSLPETDLNRLSTEALMKLLGPIF